MLGVVGTGLGVAGQHFVGVLAGVGVLGELAAMLRRALEEAFVAQEAVAVVGRQFQRKPVGGGEGVVVGFGLIAYAALEGLDGAQHVDHGAGQFGPHQAQVDGDQRQQVLCQPGLVGHKDVGGGGEGVRPGFSSRTSVGWDKRGSLADRGVGNAGALRAGCQVISKMSWSDAAALS